MALNPKQHVTLTIEELEDIKNAAMERAEEMEWQLRVELQKIREIERNLSRILGEASQVAAPPAPTMGRGTPLHGTPSPAPEPRKPVIAAVPAPAPVAPPVVTPATHVGPPPAPPSVPAPVAATAAKTVPPGRPAWPPPPPARVSASRPTVAPPPLPANVHRLNPARKA